MTTFRLYTPVLCPLCGLCLYKDGDVVVHPSLRSEGNGAHCEFDGKKFSLPEIELTEVDG